MPAMMPDLRTLPPDVDLEALEAKLFDNPEEIRELFDGLVEAGATFTAGYDDVPDESGLTRLGQVDLDSCTRLIADMSGVDPEKIRPIVERHFSSGGVGGADLLTDLHNSLPNDF